MWDVVWTDPSRELVGQHRARKDKDRSERQKSQSRHSASTVASSRSSGHSAFSRIRAKALRQSNSPKSSPNLVSISSDSGTAAEWLSDASSSVRVPDVSDSTTVDSDDVFSAKYKEKEDRKLKEQKHNPSIHRHFHQFDLQSPVRQSFTSSGTIAPLSPTRSACQNPVSVPFEEPVQPALPEKSPLRCLPKHPRSLIPMQDISTCCKPRDRSFNSIEEHTPQHGTMSPNPSLGNWGSNLRVKEMARVEPSSALSRLKEIFDETMFPEEQEALRKERKRWMLSVLHHLDRSRRQIHHSVPENGYLSSEETARERVLAVYEPEFSAQYLAALWPEKTIHHLSSSPLSSKAAPNILGTYGPKTSSKFPHLPHDFDAAYSISLPSLCRISDIPKVLDNVNECLKPKGIYHLLLIDPIPSTAALGEHMRSWLMNNLLLNLEQQSRCLNPSVVFPRFLGESSLRGPGSSLTTTKFYANPQNVHHQSIHESDPLVRQEKQGKEIRAELRSLAGRMLWKEVWGGFVTSETWWWDDPICMQECLELGTFWEYHSIQAVKAN